MLTEIKNWKEPVKRGKYTFDDKEFAESLASQFARKKALSIKQVAALKKLVLSYKDQIQDYATRAESLGLAIAPPEKKTRGGKKRN